MDRPVRIAVLGDREPAFVSHRELDAALALLPAGVDAGWLPTPQAHAVAGGAYDGVWVAPGGPFDDDGAVLAAIGHARRSGLPLLGTCSGFQYTAIELAGALAGLDARHAEAEPGAADPVIAPLACALHGQRRTVTPVAGTRLAALLGDAPFEGMHFCGFGLAPAAARALEAAGVTLAAHAPDAGVEALELPGHPFLMATLFQPQVGALAGAPLSPLIAGFVAAAHEHATIRLQ
jgi:CTP synthase (UTP-ammonia lyase)